MMRTMYQLRRTARLLCTAVASWYAMMLVHEFGHMLHAWVSGGVVSHLEFGLFEFSRTDFTHNPHPLFVAWGGAIWGCLIPLAIVAASSWLGRHARWAARFFAGFCLIANGAYLGTGWTLMAGDAGDLVRLGSQPWRLVVFGVVTAGVGLYLWHGLGRRTGSAGRTSEQGDGMAPS